MNLYSQRDPRWKDEKIGNTNSSIGDYGCTITCIAMLAGITPTEVNKRLIGANGYLRDLVIWTRIEQAIPWLKFEWRGWTYDNTKVSKAIEDNGGCLVEVDFDGTPRTNDKHWVLYTGNQKMHDPWTGTVRLTSAYPLVTGYSIINKKEDMEELKYTEAEMTAMREARDENWNLYQEEKKKVVQLEKEINDHVCPIIPEPEPISKKRTGSKEFIRDLDGNIVEEISYAPSES